METRGRQAEAEREVAKLVAISDARVEPPAILTVDEAEEWKRVVSHMSPGWYRHEYHGVLVAYCRQVALANFYHDLAAAIPSEIREADEGLKQFIKLTREAEKADRAAEKFATTLRITPQSRYDANKAARDANKTQQARPW